MKIFIDEAWRWPLAWPLYCWLVLCNEQTDLSSLWFWDSKQINEKTRIDMYEQIINLEKEWKIYYSYSNINNLYIDKHWISKSMNIILNDWINKIIKKSDSKLSDIKEILFDWNTDFKASETIWKKITTIVKWDEKVYQIWMASIIAKVLRDKYMIRISRNYPEYNFAQNKWYWTKEHIDAIKRFWASPVHRKSFLNNII